MAHRRQESAFSLTGLLGLLLRGNQYRFGLLALGDVGFDGHEVGNFTQSIEYGLNFNMQPILLTRFGVIDQFRGKAFFLSQLFGYVSLGLGIGIGALQDVAGSLAFDLLESIARDSGKTVIDPLNPSLSIGYDHRVIGSTGHQREFTGLFFLKPELILGGGQQVILLIQRFICASIFSLLFTHLVR